MNGGSILVDNFKNNPRSRSTTLKREPAKVAAEEKSLGLFLPGGGALGAWQLGFVKELQAAGTKIERILAFSAGGLTAAGYALNWLEECENQWLNSGKTKVLRIRPSVRKRAIFCNSAIHEMLNHLEDDDLCRQRLSCPITIATVCRLSKKYLFHQFSPGGQWDGPLRPTLVGSCSIPWLFPSVKTSYRGQDHLINDGGIGAREPFVLQGLQDCDQILILQNAKPEGTDRTSFNRNRYSRVMNAVHFRAEEGLSTLKPRIEGREIINLYPSKPLDYHFLDFRRKNIETGIYQGIYDAQTFLEGGRLAQDKILLEESVIHNLSSSEMAKNRT